MEIHQRPVGADGSHDDAVLASCHRAVDDLVADVVTVELGTDPLLTVRKLGARGGSPSGTPRTRPSAGPARHGETRPGAGCDPSSPGRRWVRAHSKATRHHGTVELAVN